MGLLPADYAVLGATILLTGLGLFRGFSSAFAFVVASAFGLAVVAASWNCGLLVRYFDNLWLRGLIETVVFILVFGVIRALIEMIVEKLLSQPADSIFGVVLGLFCGGLLIWAASTNPDLRAYSFLAQKVHAYVG